MTIIVIDQGTSATKGFLFDENLQIQKIEKIPHNVNRPKTGWVECDAKEISNACRALLNKLGAYAKLGHTPVSAIGMAFQRSTFLFWEKSTKEPAMPAMSWQDSRADKLAKEMSSHSKFIQNQTGIPLTGHFGGPKYLHTIQTNSAIQTGLKSGQLLFGPLSTFVTHCLTGNYLLDQSIAGRSLLMNITTLSWDNALLELFQVNSKFLPDIVPTCGEFGTILIEGKKIPLMCVIGDQQASLIGQGRGKKGDMALNFGTSGSILMNSGKKAVIVPSLLSNVLFSSDEESHYLLEGTVNSVGSLFKWLENKLHIAHEDMIWHARCKGKTNGILIPGLNGISAPYWTGEFDTAIFGLDELSHPNEYIRAGMESIGFLIYDIWNVMKKQGKMKLTNIVASGGSSREPLLQFIADILHQEISIAMGRDMTAFGVARLVSKTLYNTPLAKSVIRAKSYEPKMSKSERERKISAWNNALYKLSILTLN